VTGRAWQCASPVEDGAPVGHRGDFAWTGKRWLTRSGAAARRERGTVEVGRCQPGIGRRVRNGRLRRVSCLDEWDKVALAHGMDAACRNMFGALARS
jgi:hypothetical protein